MMTMAAKSMLCKEFSQESHDESMKQDNNLTVQFKEGEWSNTIRDVLRPVLGQLKCEITGHCDRGYLFSHLPICFSPPPNNRKFGTLVKNFRCKVAKKLSENFENDVKPKQDPVEKFLMKFLRNYDINRIREQRVFHSFSIGRKIKPNENTDETINTQIENTINGVCFRRPGKAIQKIGDQIEVQHRKDDVFSTSNLIKRTSKFYRQFAELTIDNDIEKDKKKRNKEK